MISVIVPIYNSERFLEQCIQSVVNQTFYDFELILVVDGSTDNSQMICEEWAKKDPRIVVECQDNQGASAARNTGLSDAKGEYICFIDSDDWVESDFLEALVNETKKDRTELVISGYTCFYDERRETFHQSIHPFYSFSNGDVGFFIDYNKNNLLYGPCCKLYLREIIKKHHLQFDCNLSYGEDLVFNYQYLRFIDTIRNIPVCKYHYNKRNHESLSTKKRNDLFQLQYSQWHLLVDYYKEKNLWLPQSQDFLYHRLWGIVYDGIFIYPHLKTQNYNYLKDILNIPEIAHLKKKEHLYPCAYWIKKAIIHRFSFVFYLYFCFKQIWQKFFIPENCGNTLCPYGKEKSSYQKQ